mmetsp:Transcript_6510/g.12295  ORF Transcript_6510/g.12295 Transcript_6510/m.12295 type:complete len:344 (-) Transcript_6510:142-1173(-)
MTSEGVTLSNKTSEAHKATRLKVRLKEPAGATIERVSSPPLICPLIDNQPKILFRNRVRGHQIPHSRKQLPEFRLLVLHFSLTGGVRTDGHLENHRSVQRGGTCDLQGFIDFASIFPYIGTTAQIVHNNEIVQVLPEMVLEFLNSLRKRIVESILYHWVEQGDSNRVLLAIFIVFDICVLNFFCKCLQKAGKLSNILLACLRISSENEVVKVTERPHCHSRVAFVSVHPFFQVVYDDGAHRSEISPFLDIVLAESKGHNYSQIVFVTCVQEICRHISTCRTRQANVTFLFRIGKKFGNQREISFMKGFEVVTVEVGGSCGMLGIDPNQGRKVVQSFESFASTR